MVPLLNREAGAIKTGVKAAQSPWKGSHFKNMVDYFLLIWGNNSSSQVTGKQGVRWAGGLL